MLWKPRNGMPRENWEIFKFNMFSRKFQTHLSNKVEPEGVVRTLNTYDDFEMKIDRSSCAFIEPLNPEDDESIDETYVYFSQNI